ncbi:MAG: M14 family zinc carboxypeptidase [Planctomycetaceae bacterium]
MPITSLLRVSLIVSVFWLWSAEPAVAESTSPASNHAGEILILPYNYDIRDPWEYTRTLGRLTPGMSATGAIWNRPFGWEIYNIPPPPLPDAMPRDAGRLPEIRSPHFPDRDTHVLGYSLKGIPIVLQLYGTGPDVILIFAGIHGDEANSVDLIHHLLKTLETDAETYRGHAVGIIAVANPDGLALNRRGNLRKIDLNRNFPSHDWAVGKPGRYFGGEQHSSEPETLALIQAVELLQPSRIISIHSITRGKHGNNFNGPGEKWAELMAKHNGYQVLKTIGYPTPGSFGTWAGVDRQIPTITLELPHDLTGEKTWSDAGSSIIAFIRGDAGIGD